MIIIALVLIAAQTPAAADPTKTPPALADKPICRRESTTGSNMQVKTCHTKAEWQAIDAAIQAGTDQALRNRPR